MNRKSRKKYDSPYGTEMLNNGTLRKKWQETEYNAVLTTYGVFHKDHMRLYRSFQAHYNLSHMKQPARKYTYYSWESETVRCIRFLLSNIESFLGVELPSIYTVISVVDNNDINAGALKELIMPYHESLENMLAYYDL